ncbi:MAG TPA: rod shape-determining protein MreD [Bryobacteraceae bacterium]|nr:rod shape-determining protein MreD [Bryobacteraceae bacterium]
MGSYAGRILVDDARQVRRSRYPIWVFFVVPLVALLIQIYLPLFQTLRFMAKIDLPLLVTIYFALMSRSQIRGLTIGLILGVAQDSFSRFYIGMYGLCKTMVGYFSASVGLQFDVEHPFVRMLLCLVFYLFHQFLYWVLQRAVLDQAVAFDLGGEAFLAVVHALIGVALFHFLDKLRVTE